MMLTISGLLYQVRAVVIHHQHEPPPPPPGQTPMSDVCDIVYEHERYLGQTLIVSIYLIFVRATYHKRNNIVLIYAGRFIGYRICVCASRMSV